jgi:hypothetical protein
VKNYRFCEGRGLEICGSCVRNVENHPTADEDADSQPHLFPVVSGARCANWLAIPDEAGKAHDE